jgi:hypothetical protein
MEDKKSHFEKMLLKYPNISSEAVKELYVENGKGMFLGDFIGKLDQAKILFSKSFLSTSQILEANRHPKERRTDNFKSLNLKEFYNHYQQNPDIVKSWKDKGTWDLPVWMLKIKGVYFLLEGHSRVASLICANNNNICAERHECWVLESKEAQFSDLILQYDGSQLYPNLID